jgi:TldD protein
MTTTLPAALRAPFSAGGANAIDAQLANRLLSLALDAGGDYADLYFEFRVSADYSLEEEQVRTLGRGITLGLGVRVTKGDATGYAYTEDLSWEKMAHAAKTAGQIAMGGGHKPVGISEISRVQIPSFYAVPTPSLVVPAADKLALLRAADKAARSFDPRIVKVQVSFAE